MSLGKIITIVLVAIVVMAVIDGVRVYLLIKKGEKIAKDAKTFERPMPGAPMRILVAGDSTAVGTGVTDPKDSIAGRLAQKYPTAEVVNVSINGLKLQGLVDLLATKNLGHFNLVVAQIGANDILRFTPLSEVERSLKTVLGRLTDLGDTVVILHSGNVGKAPFFPWYVRPFYSRRTMAVREIYLEETNRFQATYVDLATKKMDDLFANDPKRYYAPDYLHLTGEGYGLWYQAIIEALPTGDR